MSEGTAGSFSSGFVAVYSTSGSRGALCQQLGAVKIPSIMGTASLRKLLSDSLVFLRDETEFAFITPQGWEISRSLENENDITTDSLIGQDLILRIRINRSPGWRVGLIYEGIPIGYITIDINTLRSVKDARDAIGKQHPSLLPTSLESLQFLDVHGWPIATYQEPHLRLIDVLQDDTIRLKKSPAHINFTTTAPDKPLSITPGEELIDKVPILSKSSSLQRRSFQAMEIVISYVHKESTVHAKLLSKELNKLGYTVFLDKICIKPGDDWQDLINEAVCNCDLFVPLVTSLYGLTEWTNKEIKLADTLNKFIIPVNFLSKWPPMCLAIQFATTQYIRWKMPSKESFLDTNALMSKIAAEISDQYKEMQADRDQEDEKEEEQAKPSKLEKRASSFADIIRKTMFKIPEEGTSLIVISYHPEQLEFVQGLRNQLESRGYEMWASMAGEDLQKREVFKQKVNMASLVVFILSEQYVSSPSCEQEMYYCEGRKRLLSITVSTFQLPGWTSTLISPESIIDSNSSNFQTTFMDEVEYATIPAKAEVRLRKLVQQKTQLHRICTDLKKNLPKERLVYVTGSTKFASKNGKEICQELGKQLANLTDCHLITGGFYGVGETVGQSFYQERIKLGQPDGVIHIQAVRDPQDYSTQTHQNQDGSFEPLPYGKTLFYCDSVRQRETLTPKVIDFCILIEGGPAAAFEAHQFSWSDHIVIPVVCTGGAAAGKFNGPPSIFFKPDIVDESDWLMLSDNSAQPKDIAAALVKIVNSFKPQCE